MNPKVDPCDDFYEYACGLWPTLHPLESDWQRSSFSELKKISRKFIHEYITGLEFDSKMDNETRLIKHVYHLCLNSPTAKEVSGVNQVKRIMFDLFLKNSPHRLENASNSVWEYGSEQLETLERLLARSWMEYGTNIFVQFYVTRFTKTTSRNAMLFISPPDIEDHWPPRPDTINYTYGLGGKLRGYFERMKHVFSIIMPHRSTENITLMCRKILSFEGSLVKVIRESRAYKRRLRRTEDLPKVTGVIEWSKFVHNLSPNITEVITTNDYYLDELCRLLKRTPKFVIYLYLQWKLIQNRLNLLPPFLEERHGKGLITRERFCLRYIIGEKRMEYLGYVAARILLEKIGLNNENARTLHATIETLKEKFDDLLVANKWMDKKTKERARAKLKVMVTNLVDHSYLEKMSGYYDPLFRQTENFTDLRIMESDPLLIAVSKMEALSVQKRLNWLGHSVDRQAFHGSPALVRAFYDRFRNSVSVSAGRLYPPAYFHLAPMVINFGLIGSMYGHEMTHGFDVGGSEFDGYGTELNWWSRDSKREFNSRKKCLIDQYEKFCFETARFGRLCVNGANTLSENIADNAGVRISFAAYEEWAKIHGDVVLPTLEGFTSDQLFFISFAQLWCKNQNDAFIKEALESDTHSPSKYRVIGAFQNFEEFSKAFNCPIGSKMNPEHKCRIW